MVSFVDAIFQRYADLRFAECPDNCELFIIGSLSPGKSGNNLILPPALSLNGCEITEAGSQRKIRELCANLEELDLAQNELNTINEVLTIIEQMPNLRFLNLSENDFSNDTSCHPPACTSSTKPTVSRSLNFEEDQEELMVQDQLPAPTPTADTTPGHPRKFGSLKSLVLNNTHVPWPAVTRLLSSMPSLQELHLSLNNYTSMSVGSTFPQILRLYISGNPNLCDWHEISHLVQAFPNLQSLTMADCGIKTIPDNLLSLVPQLISLNITNWPIEDWRCLEQLNSLPHLIELRCQGLALLRHHPEQDTRRYHLIARLPRIQILNGSEISEDERHFAEKSFIRWWLVNDHVQPRPERFFELHAKHGRVDPLAEVNLAPPKYAQVTVIYNEQFRSDDIMDDLMDLMETDVMESSSDSDSNSSPNNTARIEKMKVNLNKSVKDLKQQLSTIFGLPASKMRLYYVDHQMIEIIGPEEMRYNQKKLYSYNVQDGDKFLIDPK